MKTTLRRIKRRRILIRRKNFLTLLRRSVEVPIEEVTLNSSSDEETVPTPAVEHKPRCSPVESSTPISRMPRLTREQFDAMWTESSSSSEEEEEDGAQLPLPRGDQPDPGDVRPGSKESSQYHPSTPLGDESLEDEKPPEATSPTSEDDEEPQAGPSRQQGPCILRYSQYNTQPTYIHGQVPIMSSQILVRCPPFPPYPPFFPHSPHSPPGEVYAHPRPPTPHPPSPSPPPVPPAPVPEVYQDHPPVPEVPDAPAAPAVPPPPYPVPWWSELVQGPHHAASVALLHRYLTLLEFTVDSYM